MITLFGLEEAGRFVHASIVITSLGQEVAGRFVHASIVSLRLDKRKLIALFMLAL